MALVDFVCDHCGRAGQKQSSHANRSRRIGASLYCNRNCAAAARRMDPTEKKALKAAYDRTRRAQLGEALRATKRLQYQARIERDAEAVRAKQREGREAQKANGYRQRYIRSERYRAYKTDYDRQRRSQLQYGDFAEAHMLLVELEKEIRQRCPDKYERLKARGYYERQNEKCRMKRAANRKSRSSTQPI